MMIILFFGLLGFILWLLPSIIAFIRGHNNFVPILIINIFLSFTFIGYFIALAWAFTTDVKLKEKTSKCKDWYIILVFITIVIGLVIGIVFGVNKLINSIQKSENGVFVNINGEKIFSFYGNKDIKITTDEDEDGNVSANISIKDRNKK